jgi:hypothetical protein
MYSWVRRANGTRAGPPGPYICALLRGFCEKVFILSLTPMVFPSAFGNEVFNDFSGND